MVTQDGRARLPGGDRGRCEWTRARLALLVGQDGCPEAEAFTARQHLSDCADCHHHWQQLGEAMSVLERVAVEVAADEMLRPSRDFAVGVFSRLPQAQRSGWRHRLEVGLPMLAACAAAVLMYVAVLSPQTPLFQGSPQGADVASGERNLFMTDPAFQWSGGNDGIAGEQQPRGPIPVRFQLGRLPNGQTPGGQFGPANVPAGKPVRGKVQR